MYMEAPKYVNPRCSWILFFNIHLLGKLSYEKKNILLFGDFSI